MKREYPPAPVVAVGAIISQNDCIVLICRNKEPARGRWTFPGGAVELGESLEQALHREVLEETGLHVEIGEVAAVVDHVDRDEAGQVRYHYVIVDYYARPAGAQPTAPALQPGSDVSDAIWAGLHDLDNLNMTEKAAELARKYLALPARNP